MGTLRSPTASRRPWEQVTATISKEVVATTEECCKEYMKLEGNYLDKS